MCHSFALAALVRSLTRSTTLRFASFAPLALLAQLPCSLCSLANSLVGRCHCKNESRVSQTDLANKNPILDRLEPQCFDYPFHFGVPFIVNFIMASPFNHQLRSGVPFVTNIDVAPL